MARDMSAKHVGMSSNLNSVFSTQGDFLREVVQIASPQGKEVSTRSFRFAKWCGTPKAERLVLGTSDCGFESHLHY